MSHSIGINTLVLDPWGNAVVNKNSPLSKEKVLDWRDATRSLPSEANTNLPKVPQREAQSALDRLLGSLSHSGVGEIVADYLLIIRVRPIYSRLCRWSVA